MTTPSEMQSKVDKTVTNMDRLDDFVNGGTSTTVTLDGAVVVPSIQKLVADTGWEAGAADTAVAAAGEAAAANVAALDAHWGLVNGTTFVGSNNQTDRGAYPAVGEVVYNVEVTTSGLIPRILGYVKNSCSITVRRYKKVGSNYVPVSGGSKVLVLSAGAFTLTTADYGRFPVESGDYIGFSIPIANSMTDALATGTSFTYTGTLGSSSIPVGTGTNLVFSIGFDFPVVDVTKAALLTTKILAADTAAALDQVTRRKSEVLGISQVPGSVGTILSSGASHFVLNQVATADGTIDTVDHYANVAGNMEFAVYSRAGDVWTRVAYVSRAVSVGLNSAIPVNLPIERGQYPGLYNPATGVMTSVAVTNAGYYSSGTLTSNAFTDSTTSTAAAIQTRFNLSAPVVDVEEADVAHPVTLRGCDRICIFGSSYSAGHYAIRGKHWVPKLSQWTDFMVDNYAVSGGTFASQLANLRAGVSPYGPFASNVIGGTYGWIMLGRNDAAGGLATMVENARQMIQTVRGMGMIPILSSEWQANFSTHGQLALRSLAENEGALWLDILPNSTQAKYGTIYDGFFGGTAEHPGTRTSDILANPAIAFANALPRPKQGVKIYRKRTSVSVSTVADLMFDSRFERNRLFREVYVGHHAMSVATENWYDKLENPDPDTGNYGYNDPILSEYQSLINGGSVAFADYGLMEVILPALQKDVDSFTITLSDPAVSMWYRDGSIAPSTSGLPIGGWQAVTGVSGVFTLPRADIIKAVGGDKISLLLYKSGGFSLLEPVMSWSGRVGKPDVHRPIATRLARGAALISQTDLGTLTGWTSVGTIATGVPADGMLPKGATGRVTVNASNKIKRTLTYSQDDYRDREIEIRVWCRRFPAIFNPADTYATAPITQDTFDYAQVFVDLISPNPYTFTMTGQTGLWWHEVVLRTLLPLGTTTMDIQISAASDVEVARVHAELME